MSRLWRRIICMGLVLTMLVPSQAVFAAEMSAEVPVETVAEQEETVSGESTEEVVPEEGAAEEVVPEEGAAEEVVPEEGAAEEVVPEEGAAEEVVPEEGAAEEVVPEEGAAEEVVPEEGAAEEVVPEEGAAEEVVPEESTEEVVPEEGVTEEIVPEEGTAEEVVVGDVIPGTEAADAAATTGWVTSGSEYQYIKADGSYATEEILKISGQLYAFDYDGYMYSEGEQYFSGYDTDGNYVSGYIRVQSHGGLYTNAWYEDGDYWYYYGANGLALEGLQTVAGSTYYFYYDGSMATNTTVTVDDVDYLINADGFAVEASADGWYQASGEYYYRQNGEFLKDGVYQIAGVLYGFDYDGCWYVDEEFYARSYDGSADGYHRAKADGTLYINSWYKDKYDIWYYYGANGLALEGLQTVAGSTYYFYYDGSMATNTTVTVDGVDYLIDADGFAVEASADGWYLRSGEYYYRQNGEFLEDGVYELGGYLYGFNYSGCMYAEESFYENGYYYRATASGALYENQWYYDGWSWYYYGVDGKAPSDELMTVSGVQYYFEYAGRMCTDEIVIINDKIYSCNASGVCSLLPNGWSQQKQYGYTYWFYTVNGSVVNGLTNTGSGYYVFSSSRMEEPYDGIVKDYNEGKSYLALDNSGKVVTKAGWNLVDGDYYYLNSDYSLYVGLLVVGGQNYYCDPVMFHSGKIAIDGTSYMAGTSGVLTKFTTDGFYHSTDGSFYVSGGNVLTNTWKLINGDYYYFGSSGYAYKNTVATIDGDNYAFREDGVMAASAFVSVWGDTYYANASGVLVTGEQYINGKWYYFNEYGELQSANIESASGISIYASNGEYLGTVSGDGWKYLNGNYYYVSGGELVWSEKITIGGVDYLFNSDGTMYENAIVTWGYREWYYCAAGGAIQKGGWRYFNGSYYYADATGALYRNGEYTIAGVNYYFDTNCKMADKDFVHNGTLYKVAKSGVITSKSTASTVNLANGNVVYYQQGKPFTGWKNGKYYREGELMVNGIKYCGDGYYAFDKNGNYLKNTWYDNGYSWVYLQANGKAAYDESLTIGGYTYCFDGYYMVTGLYQGKYYDDNGRLVSSVSGAGWKQVGGVWYYFVNNAPVKSRLMEIGGNTYGFNYRGVMAYGGIWYIGGNYYYFDNSGIMQKYTGWKQLNGNWFYFCDDHSLADGWLKVGGKQYYMDLAMVTGVYLVDGVLYNFGSNGVLQSGYKASDGWKEVNYGQWCYVKNGKPLSDGLQQIGGSWYYFYSDGIMAANESTSYGYATSSGALITSRGWHQLSNKKWIYIGAGNRVYEDGAYYIDGTMYVFDHNGYML